MNVSLYQAAAAMDASSRWQEAVSENLAEVSRPGFKKHEISFLSMIAGKMERPVESIVTTTNAAGDKVQSSVLGEKAFQLPKIFLSLSNILSMHFPHHSIINDFLHEVNLLFLSHLTI